MNSLSDLFPQSTLPAVRPDASAWGNFSQEEKAQILVEQALRILRDNPDEFARRFSYNVSCSLELFNTFFEQMYPSDAITKPVLISKPACKIYICGLTEMLDRTYAAIEERIGDPSRWNDDVQVEKIKNLMEAANNQEALVWKFVKATPGAANDKEIIEFLQKNAERGMGEDDLSGTKANGQPSEVSVSPERITDQCQETPTSRNPHHIASARTEVTASRSSFPVDLYTPANPAADEGEHIALFIKMHRCKAYATSVLDSLHSQRDPVSDQAWDCMGKIFASLDIRLKNGHTRQTNYCNAAFSSPEARQNMTALYGFLHTECMIGLESYYNDYLVQFHSALAERNHDLCHTSPKDPRIQPGYHINRMTPDGETNFVFRP
jgi:hypothetical protein